MSGNHERNFKGHIGDKNYKKLQRSVSKIKKNLDVENVLDDLISAEVLSIEDGLDIRHEKRNHAMADALIHKLIYVGVEGYEVFENVLRKHRYGYLVEETTNDQLKSPTESIDPNPLVMKSSSENHYHVHFHDQEGNHSNYPPSSKKQRGDSILSKPRTLPPFRTEEEENLNIVDSPGKEDDDDEEIEDPEPEVGAEGPKGDNIPLTQPIAYAGHPSKFSDWYPTKHMDKNLSQFPGCHPDVDERKIKSIVKENKDRNGSYIIWYSTHRKLLIITVINKDSPKGRYHYKVKCRRAEPEQEFLYRFSSQKEAKTVVELLEYVKREGLPPPVHKRGSSSK